jgi:hypothetical protein
MVSVAPRALAIISEASPIGPMPTTSAWSSPETPMRRIAS